MDFINHTFLFNNKTIYVMNNKILYSFFFLFLFSCEIKKEITSVMNLFDSPTFLEHQIFDIQINSNELLNPAAIEVYDNLMIVLDIKSENLFSAIDLQEKKYIKSWGSKGQGPGEFIGVMDFYNNYDQTGINAWDPMLQRLNFFAYDTVVLNFNPMPQNLFENTNAKNVLKMFYANILQLNKSLFLAIGNETKRFSLLNISTNELISTGEYPPQEANTKTHGMLKNLAYNGLIRLNKDLMKVVYISRNSEMFEIFNVNNLGLHVEYGNYTTIPEYKQINDYSIDVEKFPKKQGVNHSLSVTNKYIYILYKTYSADINEQNKYSDDINKADIVLSFDWKGHPLKMYKLDCMVNNIQYDEKNNRLYAIYDNPDPEIIYFDMN
jgi:hypothetical protein